MLSKNDVKNPIITRPIFSSRDLTAYIFVLTSALEKLLKYTEITIIYLGQNLRVTVYRKTFCG